MTRLAIHLLGNPQVRLDAQPAPMLEGGKQGLLLAYLAVEAGRAHSRADLAALLWGDRSDAEALSSLRFALSNLRAALNDRSTSQPTQTFLEIDRRQVRLDSRADVWVDVAAFQQQAAVCEVHPEDRLAALQETLGLYRGSFLQGVTFEGGLAFETWVLQQRSALERQYLHLLELLADGYLSAGSYREAEETYRRILALYPWDEVTHRRLICLLDQRGQASAALAQYEVCRLALKKELGVEPDRETALLVQAIKQKTQPAPSARPAQPLAATPFVSRERELAGLQGSLERSVSGQGQIALVTGEPGSGKTALLSEFVHRALDRYPDLLVVGGRCNAYSGLGQPYLPFIECLQMLAGEWDTLPWAGYLAQEHQTGLLAALPWVAQAMVETAPTLLDRFIGRAELAQRLAQSSGAKPGWLAALRQNRQPQARLVAQGTQVDSGALFEQITRLLVSLARRSPLVLLLDDLQWVDAGSVALLFHLARRCQTSRLLILAAYRSGELAGHGETGEHPLRGVVAELRHLRGVLQIDLDQSDESAFVSAFLEKDPFLQPHHLDAHFRTALARHTGGNPLFTAELLRNLQVRGDLFRAPDGAWVSSPTLNWQHLPERVEAAIAGRIARLPEQWCDWLATASVQGESFAAEVVARVHGLDEQILLRNLSGPLNVVRGSYRLLQFEGVQWLGEQRLSLYRFRHVLFQTYLYEQMDPAERSRRHAAVGQAMEALYLQAPGQYNRHASEIARHFEVAGMLESAAARRLEAGQHALYLAAVPSAIASYRRGLALLEGRPHSPEHIRLEIRLNLGLAAALFASADWGGAESGEALKRALDLLGDAGGESELQEVILILYAQANWLIGRSQLLQAAQIADQMLALVDRRPGLPLVLARLIAGISWLFLGNIPGALHQLQQALPAYLAAGQPATLPLIGTDLSIMCRTWLAYTTLLSGHPDQAWKQVSPVLDRVRQAGKDISLGGTLILAAEVATYRGDLLVLKSIAADLVQLEQQIPMPLVQGYSLLVQGEIELSAAEPGSPQAQAGLASIRHGMQVMETSRILSARQIWFNHLAAACLQTGQIEAGKEVIAAGLAWSGTHQPVEVTIGGEAWSRAAGLPAPINGELYRLQGELLLAGNDPQPAEAEACFDLALGSSRQGGVLIFELRAALSLARLWQSGHPAEARKLLAGVYSRFSEGWDCPDLKAARALLEALPKGDA